ncbi:OmpA family protein [Citromicrobium bathyomarinum]
MYRLFTLIAACLSCAACDTPSLYETKLAALPELQQEEGKLRLKECDRLEETIASSQDFSVGGRGAGFGFQLRSAEFKNSSAKDQYLLSLLHTVKVCREWAVFEASQEEFDNAFLAMVDVAANSFDAQVVSIDEKISGLIAAYRSNESVGRNERIRAGEVESLRKVAAQQRTVEQRLATIEDILTNPRPPSNAMSVIDTGSLLEGEWRIMFDRGSDRVNPDQIERVRGEVAAMRERCELWRASVIGYSSIVGGEEINDALAARRARNVHRSLAINPDDDWTIGGAGETQMFGSEEALNRAVRIRAWCKVRVE